MDGCPRPRSSIPSSACSGPAGFAVFLVANSGLTVLLVPSVTGPLKARGDAVGYLISALGVGYLIGSMLAPRVIARCGTPNGARRHPDRDHRDVLRPGRRPSMALAIGAAALLGIPGSILLVSVPTYLLRATPPALQGRIGAISRATASLTTIVGALYGLGLVAATHHLPQPAQPPRWPR